MLKYIVGYGDGADSYGNGCGYSAGGFGGFDCENYYVFRGAGTGGNIYGAGNGNGVVPNNRNKIKNSEHFWEVIR